MQAPGAAEFRRRLIDDVAKGYSVLCLLNNRDRSSLQQQLISDIDSTSYSYRVVDPTYDSQADERPIDVLRRQLELPHAFSLTYDLRWFLQEMPLPEIVVITGLDELGPERQRWLTFLADWAQASHSIVSVGRPQPSCLIVFLCPAAGETLPPHETRLRHHWWWSVPSALEMALLCRLRAVRTGQAIDARYLWREAILPAVSGNDPALLDFLWDEVFEDFDHLLERLNDYAQACEWSREALRGWRIDNFARHRSLPRQPEQLDDVGRRLWVQGVLSYTPEYGLMLNSAALAVIDDVEAIRHRLWRGQATLTLPLVDLLRLEACRRLAGGRHNAYKRQDFMEWGPLLKALGQCRDTNIRCLADPVEHARQVRNALAHYELIAFQDFERLARFMS